MTAVDPVFAQWLQDEGRWHVQTSAAVAAAWGAIALTTERMTCLSEAADTQAEAVRQLAFLGFASAIDEHLLTGRWAGFLGTVITVTIARLGYDAGVDVFVLGAQDDLSTGLSRVTVLRRL